MKVAIWQEHVTFPTYKAGAPDKNPMFFEKRIYQGSSGAVYPNPVIEKIEDEKVDQVYNALFLENDYLKVMILPELGGRVHMAYDKLAKRNFIYFNQVVKPALVGLCGPWISGGIEFNWPQHHRPSTFDPIDYQITENLDGSKTVWVSEIEKMFRTKGMAGFTLHPDKAYLEIKAQLYNRTNLPQTFLWWANPAVSVNDDYQSVFPPDVNAVFDHGKRDVSTFPIATGTYYKVDYSPGTDISRYKNIPVPTSYMAVNSKYDFVGGYEHDTKAGVLHVADHHQSPGKKQWTWGNGDFGLAWDRNLTDEDGPYIELMTGVYTDNQPDFTWIMPYEEKSFTQYFLPYRELGLVKNANKDILIGLDLVEDLLVIKIFSTSPRKRVKIVLWRGGEILLEDSQNLSPETVYVKELNVVPELLPTELTLMVSEENGKMLLEYRPELNENKPIPDPAKPALMPGGTENTEALFLTGQHLEQYRHATYSPVPYYVEALKREPNDIRNNNALGSWYLRRGQFSKSEAYLRTAVAASTVRNPNPYDGEPYYNLGLSLKYQKRIDEAYDAFSKAAWNSAWQDSALFSVAQIDVLRGDFELALTHIDWSLDRNARNGKGYFVKAHTLRKLNFLEDAIAVCSMALKRDQFNYSVLFELYLCYESTNQSNLADVTLTLLKDRSRMTAHNLIEASIEFAEIGDFTEAVELLLLAVDIRDADPMLKYYIAYYWAKAGNLGLCHSYLVKAAAADPAYCFPNRLEDLIVLQFARDTNTKDAKALYYLGNLWYDKRQYDEAITSWRRSVQLDDTFPTVLRNLAIASFNKLKDPKNALTLFEKAFSLNHKDARVLMELDQLYKRLNYDSDVRLAFLEKHRSISSTRDDLYLEMISLYNFKGEYQKSYDLIMDRQFHPWEGGEGKVSGQYIYSLTELAKLDIKNGQFESAVKKMEKAQTYPHNLGEGKLPGAQENDIFYWLGCSYQALNDPEKASLFWKKATVGLSEPSAAMFYNDQQPDKIFYQGMAWNVLGEPGTADTIFNNLVSYGKQHELDEVKIDFFAVSLPNLLIFEDDLNKRNYIHCKYITGLGLLGLNRFEEADLAFREVMQEDGMHFGAATHLKLLNDILDESLNVK